MYYIADCISERLGGRDFGTNTGKYKFALIKEAKAKAKSLHPDILLIDMGVGEPDEPADSELQSRKTYWKGLSLYILIIQIIRQDRLQQKNFIPGLLSLPIKIK